MIKIDRGPMPPNLKIYTEKKFKALNGNIKLTKAEQELEKAMAFFTNPANFNNNLKTTEEKFNFAVYKNAELGAELERVFGTKCAYCENDFGGLTPKEVEHFRPKSEIETDTGKLQPGYFWLAGEWENLLVSCVDCNRGRNHEVPGQPKKIKLGKETQFPLSSEAYRVRTQAALLDEERVRLLLDPCSDDDPEEHLTFKYDGDDAGLILERADAQGQPSEKGKASIIVFALQRKDLVEKRRDALNDLKLAVDNLSFYVKNHNDLKTLNASQQMLEANSEQIQKVIAQVGNMLRRTAKFQALLRGWIREGTQRGDFANLQQFKIELTDLFG